MKFIADFSETDFRHSRERLKEDGAEHQYQASEIRKVGKTLKYDNAFGLCLYRLPNI